MLVGANSTKQRCGSLMRRSTHAVAHLHGAVDIEPLNGYDQQSQGVRGILTN